MAYIMRYSWQIQWVGPNGLGQNAAVNTQGVVGPTQGPRLAFFNANPPGSQTFTSTDIANFASTAASDITNQLTQQQSRIQGFATGGG